MERIVVLLQWLILLLFVVIYTLLGLKRGTKKALYNLITSLFTTFIVLLFISFLTIKVILPPDKLLELIQKANLGDVENYILDESGNLNSNLYGVIYPILNVIFRMVLYIIIYPLFKLLLSLFVYRILWNKVFNKQKENSKTNEKVEDINTNANEVENEKIDVVKKQNKKTKEEDKNPCLRDRLIGATIGVFRGILVTFVFLLPLLGISASFSKFELTTTEGENLSTTSTSNSNLNSETIEEVIKSVKAFSNSGVGAIFNARAEGKRSFSQVLFDFGFSQNIKTDESYVDDKHTKTNFDFSKELNLYVDIFKVAYQNGYLEDFDIDNLGENPNDSKAIEEILNNLSESDLTEIIARVGTDIVINKVLPEKLEGFDPNSNTTKEIVAELKKLDWNKEFLSLSDVTKEVLLFGSVKDIKEIANNPEKLMEMSEADRKKIGTIVEEIGDLQLLIATNIGVEYMIRQDSLLNKVTWLDTKEDKIKYLETRLNFLLSNKTLVKDDITSLSTFISDLLDDDFKQLLQPILNNEKFNVDNLPTSEAVNKILTDLTDIDLLMNIFPLGIDFYVYNNMPEIVPETADKISKLFENPDTMKGEVNNIKDIYANLLEIGLQPFFEDDVKLVEVIDRILEDDTKFDSVKIIVNKLFTDSKVISDLAKLVAEPMIESKVEDEELKQVLLKALNEDFEYGKEVNNLMDILETVYSFTNLTELKSISDGDKVENILNIVKELDSDILNDLEVDIKDLQIVNNAGLDFVKYIQSKKNIEQLVISEDATNETFKNDLSKIFDIIDETVQLIKENDITKVNYKTLNLVNLLNESDLKTVLTFTESDTNSIITTSLKSILEEKITSNDNLTLPILTDSEWIDEINYIIQGAFDLINLYATSPDVDYVFSYNNLINIKSIEDIPTSLILALSSNEELNPVAKKLVTNSRDKAFENLFSSKIVNTNVNNILNDKIDEAVSKQNLTISLPNEIYNDNDMIKYNVITELLDAILPIFEKFVTTSTDNLKQTLDSINETTALEVYNDLSEIEIAKLSSGVLINNLFMDIFDNDSVQSLIVDKINETNIPENLKGTYEGLFDYDDTLTEDTLKDILLAVQSLELTEDTLKFKESYIKELLKDNKLDPLLNVDFVNKVLYNVIFLDEIKKYGETKFDEIATKVQGLELDYEYYYAILNTLETNGKLDLDELHNLFNLATLIEDINIKDYLKDNKAADLINLILDNEDKKETLSNNNLLREAISKVLNDNNIKEFAVDKLNNIKISNSNLFNLKTTDLKFSEELFDSSNLIKSEELMSVFSLISSLDLNDLKGLSNFNKFKQVFNEDVITKLFNTNLVYLTINDLLQNESIKTNLSEFLNTKLESLKVTLTPSDLYLPKTALVEGKIDKEDLIQLVNSIYSLNITSFSDLKSVKSISDIKELLTDEVLEGIFEVKLIHHSLGNIFNKVLDLVADKMNKIFEDNNIELSFEDFIPSEIKDSNGYVKEEEFISLIHEVLNVNIDDFKNINIKSFEDIKTILPLETANSIINETFLYEVFNKIINNENIRIILSEKINSKLEKLNIEISQEDIKIPSLALDDDKLYKSDIEKLISTVYSLNIQEFSSLKNIVSTSDIKELLSENTLDNLFSIKFIHYSLSNIFDNPKVLEELASKINSKFKTSLKANDFKLPSTLKDDEGYVKYTEFAEFVEVLLNTDLEFSNLKNLNTITTIRETIPEELVGNILTDTFVYEILNKVINNPVISETLASKLTEQFTKLKVSISFTADDFKLPDTAKDEEGKILTSDLDELVHVLYTLNINNLDQISNIKAVSDIKDIVTEESLKGLFNIKFLHNSLAQLLNNQNLLEQVASIINRYGKKLSLTLDKQDLYLPQELKDENGYLKAEEFVNLINELLNINLEFSNIKNLKTIDVIKEAIPEEVISGLLTDTLFYDLINIVIQKDSFKEVVSNQINNLLSKVKLDYTVEPENIKLPSTALNENGYLLNTDLETLVHTLYTLNITDFNQLTNIKSTADVRKIISDETLNSLFEIKLIHHSIGRMLNNEELLTKLAAKLNSVGSKLKLKISKNDLMIPSELKDENNYLKAEEISNLLNTIIKVDVKFSEINQLKSISKIKEAVSEEVLQELLTDTLFYDLINIVIQKDSFKEVVSEQINNLLSKAKLDYTVEPENIKLPSTALNENGYLLNTDLEKLVHTLYTLNITDFNQLTNIKSTADVRKIISDETLNSLFEIKLIHHSIGRMLNNEELLTNLADLINKNIKAVNIIITANDLAIPTSFKDENGYLEKEEIVNLLDVILDANLKFSEINDLKTISKLKVVFPEELTKELLTETMIYNLLNNLINSSSLKETIIEKVNPKLEKYNLTITKDNLQIPNTALTEDNKLLKSDLNTLVEVLYSLNIENISSLKTLPQIKETFTKPVLEKLFSIKFFHNSLAKLLNSDNLIEELTNYINKQIKSFNIELTKESLTIPSKLKDENGYIDSQSLVELVLALYNINIVNFSELNNLNTVTKIKEVFNQEFTTNLLTNTIVYDLIDNALNSNYFKDLVADKINNLLQKMKITSNIKSENINLPSVSLENGKIKKSELETFVSALYTIDYTDIDAIKKLKSVKDLNNILLTDTFEELLNTETIYYYLGYKLLQDKTLKSLAKTINSQLSKKGYYVSLTKDDFDFDNYDLYETSGTYYGYITKENLISVFEAINELDFSNLETNSTNNLINSLLEIFLEEKDNKYAVSSLLNTNLFTALYNNLLSKEFSKVYTTILNKKLSVNIDENVFDYSDSVYSGSIYSKTIKQEEIINLLKAVKELDITNNFNANSITRLLDNEDSFNNVFDSLILRSILTKALENNSLKVKLSNTINKNIDLGLIPSDFDIPTECYDKDNLLSKEEIKNILTSYKLLNLNDTKSISLNTFTDLIDSNIDTNNIDDFDRAFESKYIYSLIDKVFKKEFISNKVNESLNKVITNLNEIDLSLDDRLLENDILKYHEFKKIFVSVKLLNITDLDSINLELFMSLNNENGDLTKFLDSILIKKLVSQILTNDAIKETLASDVFNKEDLTLTPALDEYNELSVNEIKSLFDGLDLLGIDDFNNVNISVETLKELTEENVNKLLESTYLYQVIDLTLKAKIDDVPESSKEQDGNYKGFIKKSEINNLIETLKILDITDLNNVNLSNITIKQYQDIINLESSIITRMISTKLIEDDTFDIPSSSIENEKDIKQDELINIGLALEVVAGNNTTSLTDVDITNITITTNLLGTLLGQVNGTTLYQKDSDIIRALISKGINSVIAENELLGLYDEETTMIKKSELINLYNSLNDLNITDISSSIDTSSLIISTIKNALSEEDCSTIIYRLISNAIKEQLGEDASIAVESDGYILKSEIINMLDAADVLVDTVDDFKNVSINEVTLSNINEMILKNSLIIRKKVSDSLITNLGNDKIPSDVLENNIIIQIELKNLFATISNLGDNFDTIDEFKDLDVNSIDTSILTKFNESNSRIIKKMLDDNIEEALNVPKAAIDENGDIIKEEITNLISTISSLGKSISELSSLSTNMDAETLTTLNNTNSLIIRNKISEVLRSETLALTIPNSVVEEDNYNIKKEEVTKLINSISIIDESGNLSNIGSSIYLTLSFEKLSELFINEENTSEIIAAMVTKELLNYKNILVISNEDISLTELNNLTQTLNTILSGKNISDLNTFNVLELELTYIETINSSNSVILKETLSQKLINNLTINQSLIENNIVKKDSVTEMLGAITALDTALTDTELNTLGSLINYISTIDETKATELATNNDAKEAVESSKILVDSINTKAGITAFTYQES